MNKKQREILKSMKRKFIKMGLKVEYELSNAKYIMPIILTTQIKPIDENWNLQWVNIFEKKVAEIYDSDGLEGLQNDGWSIPNDWIDTIKFIP
jgi:hypothetical protein